MSTRVRVSYLKLEKEWPQSSAESHSTKKRELERLPPEEVHRRLHPEDSQRLAQFNADMTERFDSVKEQIIADLKELGKL
jgi:hypothetical protein